jgi:diguanylate cyclase (GGDEF)-like protein
MRVRKLGKLPPLLYSIPSFITAVVLRSFSVKWTLDGKVANAAIQGIVYDINFTLCFIAVIFLLVAFCASIEEMESELERKNALLADSAADLEEKNEDLRLSATTDYLTGVLNRRSIMPYFSQMKEQYEHLQIPFCAVLGDIDDFKKINDVYGHNAGDDVLIALTTTISDNMRNGDCICRWGGEEFLILLSQCDLNNAKTTMERIRDNIHKQRVTSENCEIVCTMTFGIETYRGQEFDQLTDQADAKLYYGKKHGKNQVVAQVPKQAC